MDAQFEYSSDIAFTPVVKKIQAEKGSRHAYARMEEGGAWATQITPEIKAFIEMQTSIFIATTNSEGQPYIQHRGGPAGFLKVLDAKTVAFVDFSGNRQYITTGNLTQNDKAHLFLIDYVKRQRVKIWGTAKSVEGDEELIARLMPPDYKAKAEQVIIFSVAAWDANCPKHIPQRFESVDVQAALAERDLKISALEAELVAIRSSLSKH